MSCIDEKCYTTLYLILKVREMIVRHWETQKNVRSSGEYYRRVYVPVLWKRKKNQSAVTVTLGWYVKWWPFPASRNVQNVLSVWPQCLGAVNIAKSCHPTHWGVVSESKFFPFPVVTVDVSERWWYTHNQVVFLTRYQSAPIAPINLHSILEQGRNSCSNIDRGPGY